MPVLLASSLSSIFWTISYKRVATLPGLFTAFMSSHFSFCLTHSSLSISFCWMNELETEYKYCHLCHWQKSYYIINAYPYNCFRGAVVKNLPASSGDTRDTGLIPGSGRSPEIRGGNLLQYSCLGNSMDRQTWGATVHRVTESWTWLSEHTWTQTHTDPYI